MLPRPHLLHIPSFLQYHVFPFLIFFSAYTMHVLRVLIMVLCPRVCLPLPVANPQGIGGSLAAQVPLAAPLWARRRRGDARPVACPCLCTNYIRVDGRWVPANQKIGVYMLHITPRMRVQRHAHKKRGEIEREREKQREAERDRERQRGAERDTEGEND